MARGFKAEYTAYLKRTSAQMKGIKVGQYVKVKGRLIKKLDYDEFAEKWARYEEIRTAYNESMRRGDTVNDAMVQLLDEHLAELLLRP